LLPFTETVAPSMPVPRASVTLPETVFWAYAKPELRMKTKHTQKFLKIRGVIFLIKQSLLKNECVFCTQIKAFIIIKNLTLISFFKNLLRIKKN